MAEWRCSECWETFPEHLFVSIIAVNLSRVAICPLCTWMAICSAHGVPPAELLPRGEQARRMVDEAAAIVRHRGGAKDHPARALLEALTRPDPEATDA
jgi:hypothetical protein